MYVLIGKSPFADESVVLGPYEDYGAAYFHDNDLVLRGYDTEIVELTPISEIESIPFRIDPWE